MMDPWPLPVTVTVTRPVPTFRLTPSGWGARLPCC